MKKLICKVLPSFTGYYDCLIGTEAEVVSIDRECRQYSGYHMTAKTEGGLVLRFSSHELMPVDLSCVPESHAHIPEIWVFGLAKDDTWNRQPPSDLENYEKVYGESWKDYRTYDIKKGS